MRLPFRRRPRPGDEGYYKWIRERATFVPSFEAAMPRLGPDPLTRAEHMERLERRRRLRRANGLP